MKKGIWIVISICFCFALSSCGRSEAARNADNLILRIGQITMDSKEKIDAAEEAVESLEKTDHDQLKHLPELEQAKDAYLSLQADEIEALIDAISAGDRENTNSIKRARGKYNSVEPRIQQRVENYAKLVEFENELSDLKVRELIDQIDQIGEVSPDQQLTISKMQAEYNSLKKEEKERITNYHILEEAGRQLSAALSEPITEDDLTEPSG